MKYLKNIEDLTDKKYSNYFLDFTASWCGPCQFITPKIEELSEMEKFKHIKFFKIDVDFSGLLGVPVSPHEDNKPAAVINPADFNIFLLVILFFDIG